MKIDYLFSKRNKVGSKAIAWASKFQVNNLNEYPSHVAVLLNDNLVVESVFSDGVRLVPYESWKAINTELYKISCPQLERNSKEVTDEVIRIWGRPYDWHGILYFCICFIKLIVFKEQLPTHNKWQRNTHYFCTEFAGRLSGIDYSMTTPAKMCSDLLKQGLNNQ